MPKKNGCAHSLQIFLIQAGQALGLERKGLGNVPHRPRQGLEREMGLYRSDRVTAGSSLVSSGTCGWFLERDNVEPQMGVKNICYCINLRYFCKAKYDVVVLVIFLDAVTKYLTGAT